MHMLKRVISAFSLALLIAGGAAVSAHAATSSASSTVSHAGTQPDTLQVRAAFPGCGPFNDGEQIIVNGKYWECGYVLGIGWFWWEIPPPPHCAPLSHQGAREITLSSC